MNDLNMRKRESIVTCLKDRDQSLLRKGLRYWQDQATFYLHIIYLQFNQIVIIIFFDSFFKGMYYLVIADLLKNHQGLGNLCVFTSCFSKKN